MKNIISKAIFLFLCGILLFIPRAGVSKNICRASEDNNKIIAFTYNNIELYSIEKERKIKANKYGFPLSNIVKKVKNMGFDDKDVIRYIYPQIDNIINELCVAINKEPKNSYIDVQSGIPHLIPQEDGKAVDVDKIYKDLIVALQNERDNNYKLELKTNVVSPEITSEYNCKLINLKSSFTSFINGLNQEGRIHNIKEALMRFNGLCLKPGEEVSFNNIIGETTMENGYALAKVILYGKYVDDYGGGVCQAATTIYNAALMAGLEVTEVNPHSLKVGYVKGSFDAMVSSGSSDLKIKNPYNSPVYIHTYATNNECGVKIFGETNLYDIKTRSEKIEFNEAELPKIQYKSEGYLDYYKDGQLIKSEKIRKDNYYKVNINE